MQHAAYTTHDVATPPLTHYYSLFATGVVAGKGKEKEKVARRGVGREEGKAEAEEAARGAAKEVAAAAAAGAGVADGTWSPPRLGLR
jgi:hypothetical protein